MVYFYKQYTQPTFQYSTPPLSDYSSTQAEKERHEGTFEDGCRMNNRWLASTIKKIYALVQVQIHNTHIHIQRGYVGRYIKGERACVWLRVISRWQSAICHRSASLYMEPYDSCLVLLMPLTSALKISSVVTNDLENLSQTETHTYTHPWFPAGLYRPIHSPQDKRSPSREKKEVGVFGQDYSPVRELSLGFQTPLSPPLAWSSLKRGRGEKERD